MLQQTAHLAQPITAGTYKADRERSDPYLPAMKAAAGMALFVATDLFTDRNLGCDLTTITGGGLQIACRVRDHKYLEKYGGEFTLRDSRTSGAETELAKVLAGSGTHIVYAFAHAYLPGELAAWTVGKLDVFRHWYRMYEMQHGIAPGTLGPPQSDGTRFRAFDLAKLPRAFIVQRHAA